MIEKSTSTIEIRRAGNDEYYFVFRLPGDGMFVSLFFDNISEAMAVAEYLQRKSKDETRYLCKTKSSGENCFVFLTKDNKPIGQSAVFEKVQAMKVGLQYMQKHLQTAEIVDLTNWLFSTSEALWDKNPLFNDEDILLLKNSSKAVSDK